jgi:oligopeptidase A
MTETLAWVRAHDPEDPSPSVIPKTITPENNPFLRRDFRIPFKEIRPQHVGPGVLAVLSSAQEEVDSLAGDLEPRSWNNTLGRLDRITQDVSEALAPLHHLMAVAETPELRETYNAVLPEITRFWSRLPLHSELWDQVKAFADTHEAHAVQGLRARHLQKTLRDFRRAGADLPPDGKARVEEIRVELARLQRKFSENVLDATAAWELLVTDEGRMEGIPEGPRSRFRAAAEEKGLEGWLLSLDHPSYEPVMKYAAERSLREEVFRAYVGRCRGDAFDNVPLLPQILASAPGVGRHPGTRGLRGLPPGGGHGEVRGPGRGLRGGPRHPDPALLGEGPGPAQGPRPLPLSFGKLEPWDVAFVAESLRRDRFHVDDELLRPYFPLDKVLHGLFDLSRQVFGLTVSEVENPQVWHPDVRFYDLRDERRHLAGFLLHRLVPPEGEAPGSLDAGSEERRARGRRDTFQPHLGFMAGNFSPPEDGNVPLSLPTARSRRSSTSSATFCTTSPPGFPSPGGVA